MPKLIGDGDVSYFQNVGMEVYQLFMIPLKIFRIREQEYNTTYNEDANKQFYEAYEIEGYIVDLPSFQNSMTRFGIDETRDLKVYFSIKLIQERNVIPPVLGDHIEIQGIDYKVVQANSVEYGSNLQIPLSYVVDIKRVRSERPEQGNVITKDY